MPLQVGVLLEAQQLKGIVVVDSPDKRRVLEDLVIMTTQKQGKDVLLGVESDSRQRAKGTRRASVQHYLVAPGHPTTPTKLAQSIWDMILLKWKSS